MSSSSAQELAERRRAVYVCFERDGEGGLTRLAELYHRDVVFRYALQTSNGRAGISSPVARRECPSSETSAQRLRQGWDET